MLNHFQILVPPVVRFDSSSVFSNDVGSFGPQLLADKKIIHDLSDGGLFHTDDSSMYPWLRIDFGKIRSITTFRIVNRKDCCFERFKNVVIRVGNIKWTDKTETAIDVNTICATPPDVVTDDDIIINCHGLKGKHMTIQALNVVSMNLNEIIFEFPMTKSDFYKDLLKL